MDGFFYFHKDLSFGSVSVSVDFSLIKTSGKGVKPEIKRDLDFNFMGAFFLCSHSQGRSGSERA